MLRRTASGRMTLTTDLIGRVMLQSALAVVCAALMRGRAMMVPRHAAVGLGLSGLVHELVPAP